MTLTFSEPPSVELAVAVTAIVAVVGIEATIIEPLEVPSPADQSPIPTLLLLDDHYCCSILLPSFSLHSSSITATLSTSSTTAGLVAVAAPSTPAPASSSFIVAVVAP